LGGRVGVQRTTIAVSLPPIRGQVVEHDPGPFHLGHGVYRKPTPGPPAVIGGVHPSSAAHLAAIPSALDGLKVYDSQPVQYSPSRGGSPVPLVGGFETTAADGGGVVFFTANWDAAYSSDVLQTTPGSAAFTQINPFTALSPAPAGMSFCCDQVARYVPPNTQDPLAGNFFVWVLQYANNATPFGNNVERVAVASPAQVAAGQWAFFDVSGALVRHSGAFLDYPDVEVGQHHLYLTFNDYDASKHSQGATVVRFPLAELGAIAQGGEQGLPSYQFYNDTNVQGFRVVQNPTPESVTYFATLKDDSDLTVYAWDESPNGQISQNDVGIPTIGKGGLGLPNGQWLGALNGSPGDQRIRAVTTSDILWPHLLVTFEGGSDASFPQPQIDIADINTDFTYTGGFSLNRMNYIWSPSQAFGNVELATNEFGAVAISFWHNAAGVLHSIGAISPNLSDPSAPLLMNLGPDTTSGANTAGGADYTSLEVSYANSANYDTFPCFSEAQWTGTPGAASATWDTFGVPGIGGVCPTYGPATEPPSPPIGQAEPTSLSLNCPTAVQAGQNILVSGRLSYTVGAGGGVNGRPVVISYKNGATEHTVVTDPNGLYTDVVPAGPPPTWTIEASFAGDQFANPATASRCQVTIQPAPPPPVGTPSSLSISCPTAPVNAHIGTLGVSGGITPERDGAPVTIVYTQPDGTTTTHQTAILSNQIFKGSYLDDITPEEAGTWHVQARWPGDTTYAGATSDTCAVTVNPPPPR
jgi:hypothetical protein